MAGIKKDFKGAIREYILLYYLKVKDPMSVYLPEMIIKLKHCKGCLACHRLDKGSI